MKAPLTRKWWQGAPRAGGYDIPVPITEIVVPTSLSFDNVR